jgi:hypothetical protein
MPMDEGGEQHPLRALGERMSISSLQSLIAKYGANFGLHQKAPDPESAAAAAISKTAETASDTQPAKPAGDSVELSPQAKDYLKAHTDATGKFRAPNVFGDLMSALDPDPAADDEDQEKTSLLDFLSPGSDSGSATQLPSSLTQTQQTLKSLDGFLG